MLKRGQLSSETFVYALTVVLVGIIVVMGYGYISSSKNTASRGSVLQLQTNLVSDIKSVGNDYGASKRNSYGAPAGLDDLCFADLSKKDEILSSVFITYYPLIMDSIRSGSNKNMFLIGHSLQSSFFVEDLRINHYPYIYCIAAHEGKINLDIKGLGGQTALILGDFIKKIKLKNSEKAALNSADGKLSLEITAGTITNANEISVETIDPPLNIPILRASDVYQFQPSGAIFSRPVLAKISYNPAVVGKCPPMLSFYHFDDDGDSKEVIPAKSIDCKNNIAAFEISGFSYGYVAIPNKSSQDISELTSGLLSPNGREFAMKRKQRMSALIESNPQEFLSNTLTEYQRSQMPPEVQEYIEKETTLFTTVDVLHSDDFEKKKSEYKYFVSSGNKKLELHLAGKTRLLPGAKVKIKGFRLDDQIVASSSQDNVQILGAPLPQQTTGEQKIAVFLVDFLDSGTRSISKEQAAELIFGGNVQEFYKEASYGNTHLSGDVFDWYRVSWSKDPSCNPYWYEPELERIVNSNHMNLENYGRILILTNNKCTVNGASDIGKKNVRINGKDYSISISWVGGLYGFSEYNVMPLKLSMLEKNIAHELGHNLGASHANAWECGNEILYGRCTLGEYGNNFDIMGEGNLAKHFNAFYKDEFQWLEPAAKIIIDKSGRYAINPLESPYGTRAAIIRTSSKVEGSFYLEYRRAIGYDYGLDEPVVSSNQNGLFVNQVGIDESRGGVLMTKLLDMTPGSGSFGQVTLNVGQKFEDKKNGITIEVISADDNEIIFDATIDSSILLRVEPDSYSIDINKGDIGEITPIIYNDGTKSFDWFASSQANLLKLDGQASGSLDPGKSTDLHTKIDAIGLQSGKYKAELLIKAKSNGNDIGREIKIPVNINVIETGKTSVFPKELSFSIVKGSGNPEDRKIMLINDNSFNIGWSVRTSVNTPEASKVTWLDTSTESGSKSGNLVSGKKQELLAHVNADSLEVMDYYGVIYITIRYPNEKGETLNVPVKLAISAQADECVAELSEGIGCSQSTKDCLQPCDNVDYYCVKLDNPGEAGVWAWRTQEEISPVKCTDKWMPCAKFEWPADCKAVLGEAPKGNSGYCYAFDAKFHFDFEELCNDKDKTVTQKSEGGCAGIGMAAVNCDFTG